MTKRVFISFTILFTVVVCTALDCKKWTTGKTVMSSVNANLNGQHYSGKSLSRSIGGWEGEIYGRQRNDSSFFYISLPRLYNDEDDANFDLTFYIVEPTITRRPINGKVYEFKKGQKINTEDRQLMFQICKPTVSGIFSDLDKKNGTLTIRDGWIEYHESDFDSYYVSVNCDFYAVLESENGDIFTLSEGNIFFRWIRRNTIDYTLQ